MKRDTVEEEVTEEMLKEVIDVYISETDSVSLLDIPSTVMSVDTDESEAIMFQEGATRCAGTLEINYNGDGRLEDDQTLVAVACRQLDCGSAVSWQTIRSRTLSPLKNLNAMFDYNPPWPALKITCSGQLSNQLLLETWCQLASGALGPTPSHSLFKSTGGGEGVGEKSSTTEQAVVMTTTVQPIVTVHSVTTGCCKHQSIINVHHSSSIDSCSKYGIKHSKMVNYGSEKEVMVINQSLQSTSISQSLVPSCRQVLSKFLTASLIPESVRLNGTNRCSGRLEVKSDESWSSVCEGEFDQQVAEVVCRELNCGVPSFLQGALYGKVDASVWSREFQCEGNEYHLLECHRSTCSSGRTLGLTCSDPGDVRLVGGASHCSGVLQLKHRGVWRAVNSKDSVWNLKAVNIICHQLDCGSSVSTQRAKDYLRTVWRINSSCFQSTYKLRECLTTSYEWSYSSLEITCSESVRLVNGTSRCSGRLEVKSDESWSSVCEGEFDQQVAEVVCRELDCGVPSVLQGALYGEVEAPVWSREFQCEGNESHLLDCKWSDSAPSTCSPDKAVGLTCSYPLRVRLVGERSRCAGELEVNHQRDWRPVADWDGWDQMLADKLESALWECVMQVDDIETYAGIDVICSGNLLPSGLLVQPNVSVSPIVGVSGDKQQGYHVLLGSSFTVTCSTEPQYQEGSFHLLFNTSDMAQNYTLPAVNHSAHFLFPAARSAHRGDYTCVYHVYVFSYNFSSESRPLHLIVSASVTDLIIRCVVALLVLTVSTTILYFHFKVTDTHNQRRSFSQSRAVELVLTGSVCCCVFPGRKTPEEREEPPATDRTEREA
ncbi:putative scavenger receptor cysteine-rich type 1 protein M130-like [Scophthalmus maximus]|uniref:Putative scavenger receptor cysteine-rich type 1 protein M130-like n=1 Tax=Scophthalmus maximus TaxID=52904 RepID=A0A2U9BKY1_SCOMX|nr:putative scavenger receptor cysteine-rich type 1 protein M130-like [Scophthalmus maximus]